MADSPKLSKKERRELARKRAQRRQLLRGLAWGGGIVVVVAVVAVVVASGRDTVSVTDPAAFDLPAMGSTAETQDRVRLTEFSGSPTIVNFFASWCVECDRELPAFMSVYRDHGDQIDFVGVASQETGDPMTMPRRHGLDGEWPLAQDAGPGGSGMSRALGARGMPLTAFYDSDGNLLGRQLGAMDEATLRSAIAQLYDIGEDPLAEAPG